MHKWIIYLMRCEESGQEVKKARTYQSTRAKSAYARGMRGKSTTGRNSQNQEAEK